MSLTLTDALGIVIAALDGAAVGLQREWSGHATGQSARFAVMAVVILPVLPAGPYGPLGGLRPRQLWLTVLFCSGLSFAGYLARRAVGPGRGYPIAGNARRHHFLDQRDALFRADQPKRNEHKLATSVRRNWRFGGDVCGCWWRRLG
jgi:hypothetical protein